MRTTLKFYVKQIENKHGKFPIYIRIIQNGKKAEGKTLLKPVSKKESNLYNDSEQAFMGALPNHNAYINSILLKFEKMLYYNEILPNTTSREIRDKILYRVDTKSIGLIEAYDDYIQNIIMPDRGKKLGTIKNYRKTYNHMVSFLKKEKMTHILLNQFNEENAEQFSDYLTSKMQAVSARSVLSKCKPFFKKMKKTKKIESNPFDEVIITAKEKEVDELEITHYKEICDIKTDNFPSLELYVDIFKFLCHTGMSYVDFTTFNTNELYKIGDDTILKYRRIKTDITSKQVLTKEAMELINKYKDYDEVKVLQTLLPKRSNKQINLALKNIGLKANIHKPLYTKHARRFFRQSLYDAQIPEELTKKTMMGHSTAGDITSKYLAKKDGMFIQASELLNKFHNTLWT